MSWLLAIENSFPYWCVVCFYGLYPIVTSLLWMIGGMTYYFRRDLSRKTIETTGDLPLVSILIPAYCEEETIAQALEGAVRLDYPEYEVIVVNDGSVDRTVERVLPFLADPHVRLLDKQVNEGKAMALNDGLACAKGDLVLVMDADSIPDPMLLRRMAPHFRSPHVGAVAGNPRVRNRTNLLARLQAVEFTSVIGLLRRAQRIWGRVMCVSGVCGMFRKQALIDAGMYSPGMATEDIDLTWKLQLRGWDVRYEGRALVWMVVPETIPVWWQQRRRWAKGLGQVLRRHASMFTRREHRAMYPIFIESVLSVLWAVVFVVVTAFWILCYSLGHPPRGGSPIPSVWGMLMFSSCLMQLACGIVVDARYERSIVREAPVAVLYPLFYWALLAATSCVYALHGLFATLDLKRATTWRLHKGIARTVVLATALVCAGGLAGQSPRETGDRARDLARKGETAAALALYRDALGAAPGDVELRRDYAVVLGWAGRYPESLAEFRKVRAAQPQQPLWALAELARSELFGGPAEHALATLNLMIAMGDHSEATYVRKGLALRWLGRAEQAEGHYRAARDDYPRSEALAVGLAYALADRDQMREALVCLNGALGAEAQVARARLLGWMGRGAEARRLARAAVGAFPEDSAAARLHGDLELEYGGSVSGGFRAIGDSDGLLDRTWSSEVAMHANPAHRFRLGFLDRRLEQEEATLGWRRYEAGWSGVLSRRLVADAALADHEYFSGLRRWSGDASVSFAASDRVRLSASGGVIAMDAFQSVATGVTARFWAGSAVWRPAARTSLEVRTGQYFFSDGVRRGRMDAAGFRDVFSRRRLRLEGGGRTSFLWHDRETADFFSPSFYQAHLAVLRARGNLRRSFEYRAEVGAGVQREPHASLGSPLQVSGGFTWHPRRDLTLAADAGRTTASVERVNPGRLSYSRRFATMVMTFRFR